MGVVRSVEPDGYEGEGVDLYSLYEVAVTRVSDERERRQADEIDEELSNMRRYGAADVPCRKERGASEALPPPTKNRDTRWLRSIPRRRELPQMRLYLWKSGDDVVLFAGGLKTHNDPESCPNVKEHFLDAGTYAGRLAAEVGLDLRIVDGHLVVRIGPSHTNADNYAF